LKIFHLITKSQVHFHCILPGASWEPSSSAIAAFSKH
jgi:hypothetical protein